MKWIIPFFAMLSPALGAPNCGHIDQLQKVLEEKYGERQFAQGVLPMGGRAFVWVNPSTGTFTIFFMPSTGDMACLSLSGDGFELDNTTKPGKDL